MATKKFIPVPTELFLESYKYLVLYGLLHGIGETDMYNTFLKQLEEFVPAAELINTENDE